MAMWRALTPGAFTDFQLRGIGSSGLCAERSAMRGVPSVSQGGRLTSLLRAVTMSHTSARLARPSMRAGKALQKGEAACGKAHRNA